MTIRAPRILFWTAVILSSSSSLAGELPKEAVREWHYTLSVPDDWELTRAERVKGMGVFVYTKRATNERGQEVRPTFSAIFEKVTGPDATAYSIMKRLGLAFRVQKVFTHENGIIGLKNAIGYRGELTGEPKHAVIIVHAVHPTAKIGAQFICEAPPEVMGAVENEYMKILRSIMFAERELASPAAATGTPSSAPIVERTGKGTTLKFPNGQIFILPPGKGLLGPSSNPSSQIPFANDDGSMVALNEQPMTKTSFVRLYLKGENGQFIELTHANQKIREATASVANINIEFIRIESIKRRTLELETVYDFISNPRKRLSFKVAVAPDGRITRVQ